jgi:hypothetical protein
VSGRYAGVKKSAVATPPPGSQVRGWAMCKNLPLTNISTNFRRRVKAVRHIGQEKAAMKTPDLLRFRLSPLAFLSALVLVGCGNSSGGAGTKDAGGTGGTSAGTGGRSQAGGATGTGGTRAGTGGGGGANATTMTSIAGTVGGKTFNTVTTALWIGNPDPNNPSVTVVYLFEMAVDCSAITATGWDATLGNANQDLELKAAGTTPGTYTVRGGNPAALAAGEAVVNHSVLMTTPVEQIASAGSTVTLTALNPGRNATGSFDLTFPNGSLKGTFNATWCPNGREP